MNLHNKPQLLNKGRILNELNLQKFMKKFQSRILNERFCKHIFHVCIYVTKEVDLFIHAIIRIMLEYISHLSEASL